MNAAPAVWIRDLSFHYPDGHAALNRLSLCVAPGEKIALVGPNGAGKSTLLLHLNGILRGEGEIRILDRPIDAGTLPTIRALVGLVFQSPDDQLFSPTVFDDVAFGPIYQGLAPEDVRQRVAAALEAVDMPEYARRASHHLSVGEKKRVAVATVLAMQPQILALDEPSAGLDPRARRTLIELLARLPQTMLVATHDLALARDLLPRMVVIDGGQVVADGPTRHLLDDTEFLVQHGLI